MVGRKSHSIKVYYRYIAHLRLKATDEIVLLTQSFIELKLFPVRETNRVKTIRKMHMLHVVAQGTWDWGEGMKRRGGLGPREARGSILCLIPSLLVPLRMLVHVHVLYLFLLGLRHATVSFLVTVDLHGTTIAYNCRM